MAEIPKRLKVPLAALWRHGLYHPVSMQHRTCNVRAGHQSQSNFVCVCVFVHKGIHRQSREMQLMDWDAFQALLMTVITEVWKILQILTLNYNVVKRTSWQRCNLLSEQSIPPGSALHKCWGFFWRVSLSENWSCKLFFHCGGLVSKLAMQESSPDSSRYPELLRWRTLT